MAQPAAAAEAPRQMRVVIVGAGVSGLAAASELIKNIKDKETVQIILLEAAAYVGKGLRQHCVIKCDHLRFTPYLVHAA